MPTLSKELRRMLENTVADARKIAEAGAEQALSQLAVHHSEPWPAMTSLEKALREKLRAHGKQLGDKREPNRTQEIPRLRQACAYEHWHRMLFARFLAENNLLIHPDYGEPISLDEVKELAREQNADWLSLAASFAQRMLLEVFRLDDPVLQVILPPETRQKLEDKLASLPEGIFTAEDSLGWVYQFWQRDEKDAVNKSEVKIGADQLAAVTQLFTEDYMVRFLLHNTLGSWWTSKRRGEGKDNLLPGYEWTYLRVNDDGTPCAGDYKDWPERAKDLRVLDPSMGSGHFLTFALPILARMRMVEEGLLLADAIVAVLRDNLFGLELDARCSQIAAFNLALTAWRLIGNHCSLPPMNLACSGLGINASEADWMKLAGDDGRARQTMQKLYALFRQAPTLGSLIDPTRFGKELFAAEFSEVQPLLEAALASEQHGDEAKELAIAAQGLLAAAGTLASEFTLVATNVPYLGRGSQDESLRKYCKESHDDAKGDLATSFLDRCIRFCGKGSSLAMVTKQEPLSLTTFKDHRAHLLKSLQWNFVARLGPRAFETITGERVNVVLLGLTRQTPPPDHEFPGWDVGVLKTPTEKAVALATEPPSAVSQKAQRDNPDSVIAFKAIDSKKLLGHYATCYQGTSTGDAERLVAAFWEIDVSDRWRPLQMPPMATRHYYGREFLVNWSVLESGFESAAIRGRDAWGCEGIAIGQVSNLPATLYTGELFADSTPVVIPKSRQDLPAIWAYCSSPDFNAQLRRQNPKLSVNNGYVGKIPFDLGHWQEVAGEKYPSGLPAPYSDDPTQWLFDGHPNGSGNPLQVAVARLVGYRWPRQMGISFPECPAGGADGLDAYADADGIACLSSIGGEAPAAERLRGLFAEDYGASWSSFKLSEILGNRESLEDWLRDGFFQEHCELFHNRPFVWHVWDGRNDGFHALVNYHKLAAPNGEGRKTLDKLIYTVLGDWIRRQREGVDAEKDGAEARLAAAQHLQSEMERIFIGEAPYDIFARWKPIHEQAMGWEPDLNDGIRINIRPWLIARPLRPTRADACILRTTPRIKYGRDRGKEPARDKKDFPWFADSTERNNEINLTLKQKQEARERRRM